jgi:acetylornithine deacetylase/succinyl-diaminopimelate desuccinylase-like protein
MTDLKRIYATIDQEKDRFVRDLQTLVRQPSVSSQSIGVRDCAELLVKMMAEVGVKGRVIDTAWQPVAYGEIKSPLPGAPTIVIYNHYDTQPADPVELWEREPFGAQIEGDYMYGRGTTDSKGGLISHLKAIDAYKTAGIPLPCNIRFLFDGEEESGSPSLDAFVQANKDILMADAALNFDGGFDNNNRPRVKFGSSGLLFVELQVKGAAEDLHSGRARLVQNPAWRLVWFLNKLKAEDGRINIPGFYDAIRPVSDVERKLLADIGFDDEKHKKALGVTSFVNNVTGLAAFEQWLFTPTCNIAGIGAGYMGEGRKTVLPSRAGCRIDFRLVADQQPDEILKLFRKFLQDNGCGDFEVTIKGHVRPSRTSADNPFAQILIDASKEIYPQGPSIMPTGDASGKQGVWLAGELGGIPAGQSCIGPPNWRGHAPNEFTRISYYVDGIKYSATIMAKFGEAFRKPA